MKNKELQVFPEFSIYKTIFVHEKLPNLIWTRVNTSHHMSASVICRAMLWSLFLQAIFTSCDFKHCTTSWTSFLQASCELPSWPSWPFWLSWASLDLGLSHSEIPVALTMSHAPCSPSSVFERINHSHAVFHECQLILRQGSHQWWYPAKPSLPTYDMHQWKWACMHDSKNAHCYTIAGLGRHFSSSSWTHWSEMPWQLSKWLRSEVVL